MHGCVQQREILVVRTRVSSYEQEEVGFSDNQTTEPTASYHQTSNSSGEILAANAKTLDILKTTSPKVSISSEHLGVGKAWRSKSNHSITLPRRLPAAGSTNIPAEKCTLS